MEAVLAGREGAASSVPPTSHASQVFRSGVGATMRLRVAAAAFWAALAAAGGAAALAFVGPALLLWPARFLWALVRAAVLGEELAASMGASPVVSASAGPGLAATLLALVLVATARAAAVLARSRVVVGTSWREELPVGVKKRGRGRG